MSTGASAQSRHRVVAATTLATLAAYVALRFPGVGGALNHGDSAKFQFLGVIHGVGHAPGNPSYLYALDAVQALPFGSDPATRANLLSAVCGAATVGLVTSATHRIGGHAPALLAAFALAGGGLFASLSTEAEVYAFASVFLAVGIDALTRAHLERRVASLTLALCAFTLGLSSHLALAFAGPAVVAAWWMLHRGGVRISRQGLLAIAACAALVVSSYAGLALRHRAGVAYSEFGEPASVSGLVRFVTAERFRGDLRVPDLAGALRDRPLALAAVLGRQWWLPLWLAVPMGWLALRRRAAPLAAFTALALVGWMGFAYLYDIPDPDGFLVPVVVTASLLLGLAASDARHRAGVSLLLGLAIVPSATLFVEQRAGDVAFDVLEDLGRGGRREGLDLPDLVRRIPEGARLTVPCAHYGCACVTNYHRFAAPATRARGVEFVTLQGGMPYTLPMPPAIVTPADAARGVVCTVQPFEVRLLESRGVRMRTIQRPDGWTSGHTYSRVPVSCSVPTPDIGRTPG